MKLGLGTAQFGMPYGVTNAAGRVAPEQAAAILRNAADGGVDLVDTAAAYGESEAVLGAILWPRHPFRIVSKLPPLALLPPHGTPAERMEGAVEGSLRRLRQDTLYGLLLHRAADLCEASGPAVLATLNALKRTGRVAKIGVSVYGAAEIDAVLERCTPDIVQLPLNALDQRLLRSGHVARLAAAGVEIHARSIFLQGVLLADPADLPDHFSPFLPVLQRFREKARASGTDPLRMALRFVSSLPAVHAAIVGVTTPAELDDIQAAFRDCGQDTADWSGYRCDDEKLVNPSLWPAREARREARIPS